MLNKSQDILAWSLSEIKMGRLSLEDALASYPKVRPEVEPLLLLALALRPPDLPEAPLSLRRRIRAQLRPTQDMP